MVWWKSHEPKSGWLKHDGSKAMKTATLTEAQQRLPELVRQAQHETIGLTDEHGNLVGFLSGVNDDDIDDLLVQTPGFKAMIERSKASLETGEPVPLETILAEARAALAAEEGTKAKGATKKRNRS
jgi:hypothetical protein